MLHSISRSRKTGGDNNIEFQSARSRSTSNLPTSPSPTVAESNEHSPSRRQRRRYEHSWDGHHDDGYRFDSHKSNVASGNAGEKSPVSPKFGSAGSSIRGGSNDQEIFSATDSEGELRDAVGQLSLNEDEQVRYHGKASGLHLLGDKVRVDGRNEGGIW
jgi:hypothetical protein